MSTLNVDKVDPSTGTALELGTSGDTITVPTGAGLTVVDEVKTNKISPATGTAFALGDSGDTFTVPSGATIVNSGTATGFGGGKIGQVINATLSSEVSSTTATFADTGLTVDITPTATSSKVLVIVCASESRKKDHASAVLKTKLLRDSTDLVIMTNEAGYTASTAQNNFGGTSATYLDSPSSTSALTYKVQFANGGGSDGSVTFCNSTSVSTITVMEVLA